MVTYSIDEIILATLAGVLCEADDLDAIAVLSRECVTWLKPFLPDKRFVAKAQTPPHQRKIQNLQSWKLNRAGWSEPFRVKLVARF
ncbi:MAG: hypothetical protein ACRECZ_03310 [Methylocella sp.]